MTVEGEYFITDNYTHCIYCTYTSTQKHECGAKGSRLNWSFMTTGRREVIVATVSVGKMSHVFSL